MKDVSLLEMLNAREARCYTQRRLLDQYKKTMICFTLNIPGPVKILPGIPSAYYDGCQRIEAVLNRDLVLILHLETVKEKTGYEAYYCVDASPEFVKERMIALEDSDSLGRLFDIDVLRTDGTKVSREELGFPPRSCLLCGEPAHACSRSRTHSVEELVAHIQKILNPALAYLTEVCRYALIAEVSATPKPGLVDRHDSGAHTDMCYDTFVSSTNAIVPYLTEMAQAGFDWVHEDGAGLFSAIRPIGIDAEQAMFAATNGINTHKGMIFSMGTIAAAAGLYYRLHQRFHPEEILLLAGRLCHDTLEQDFLSIDQNNPRSHGEILYVHHGCKGIRGEAQNGFPSIRLCSIPAIRQLARQGLDDNTIYLNTLLHLMAEVDDTNVLIRTSTEMLAYEKQEAARILSLGGGGTSEGMEALTLANEAFIKQRISPGGCADLLAVTIFLSKLEEYQNIPVS